MNNLFLLKKIFIINLVFLIFSWWRITLLFYFYCGDNPLRWKTTVGLYFLLLLIIGYILSLQLKNFIIIRNKIFIYIFSALTLILTISNTIRIFNYLIGKF